MKTTTILFLSLIISSNTIIIIDAINLKSIFSFHQHDNSTTNNQQQQQETSKQQITNNNKINSNNNSDKKYGVDVSFPIHHSTSFHNLHDTKKQMYRQYILGCREMHINDTNKCISSEKTRLEHNLNQPRLMKNYTTHGYQKMTTPKHLHKLLSDYFQLKYIKNTSSQSIEQWPVGNTYVNHWVSPTYMVPISASLKRKLTIELEPYIQKWTSQNELKVSSVYGIRIYKNNSILAPHVDRIPLISSIIVNVDQDVDVPWPLEVYGHDGYAHNITLLPGEMILYESHSIIHGRPFPLKGRYYANVFIHFEPVGFINPMMDVQTTTNNEGLSTNVQKKSPPIIKRQGKNYININLYLAAANDDLTTFQKITNESLLYRPDDNGWLALHEASRAGSYNVVQFLLQHGSSNSAQQQHHDINARTNFGYGGTALYWALRNGDSGNNNRVLKEQYEKVIHLLKEYGGILIGPE